MSDSGIGAAALGFYAAIKICLREEYNPQAVFDLMLAFVKEQQQSGNEAIDANKTSKAAVSSDVKGAEQVSPAKKRQVADTGSVAHTKD